MFEAADECSPRQNRVARDALLNLVLSTIFDGGARPDPGADAAMLHAAAIHRHIRANLTDAAMTPGKIAAAHGISVRHLHRIFATTGRTLGEWIRDAKLERCARDLCDGSQKFRSITDIAYRWGFNESAHFSRTFKRAFGQSRAGIGTRTSPEGSAPLAIAFDTAERHCQASRLALTDKMSRRRRRKPFHERQRPPRAKDRNDAQGRRALRAPQGPRAFSEILSREAPAARRDIAGAAGQPVQLCCAGVGAASPYFCIWEGEFANAAAMGAGMQSPIGQQVAADTANYATGGLTIIHYSPESRRSARNARPTSSWR